MSTEARATAVDGANQRAIQAIANARVKWIDVLPASEALPALRGRALLHAGPPVAIDGMCSAMRNAAVGALVFEGWARDLREAAEALGAGGIDFASAHDHHALGPMAGIISPSMPVLVLEDGASGNRSYVTINEGLGRTLRFGANDAPVIERLRWIRDRFAPLLRETVALCGPVDITGIISRAVQRGDECHNRNKAATSLLIREIAPSILKTSFGNEEKIAVLEFLNSNDHTALNLSMPAAKATLEPAGKVKHSTIVYTMARNGTEFGIRVAALGERWFTAPAEIIDGLYFPGFSMEDANPDVGDSCITETLGIGGFSMATAPAIVQFVGGTPKDAVRYTTSMYEITTEESRAYKLPPMNFRGAPTGIDIRKVIETQVLPVINTGIAHKEAGVGQVGAGIVHPPMACFEQALEAYVNLLDDEGLLEE